MLVTLLMGGVLAACGDSTATSVPVPTTATAVTVPTATQSALPTAVANVTPAPIATILAVTPTAVVTTAFPTPLPPFSSNQEMADSFKAGPNVEEIPLDLALLQAVKAYFNNDPELVVKLFAFSGTSVSGFGFDPLKSGYYPESPTPGSNVTGSIFHTVLVRSARTGDSSEDLPQTAIYDGKYGSNLNSQNIRQSIEELNRFSQNSLDTEKLLARVQGKNSLVMIVSGKHLLGIIQSKRAPEPTLTPVPALAITPSGKPIIIKENDRFEGELKVYKLVYDSSQSYTSIRYLLQFRDADGQVSATMNYTAVRPRLNNDIEQELDTEWISDTFTDRVIIVGGQRYENSRREGWIHGEYHGLSEGDYAGWGKAYAEILSNPRDLKGYNFTLLPDETFKGQTVGHFILEKPGENAPKYEVRYNTQNYKPLQIIFSYTNNQSGGFYIDYEYNNPAWKILEPSKLPVVTPVPTRVRVENPTATIAPAAPTAPPTK